MINEEQPLGKENDNVLLLKTILRIQELLEILVLESDRSPVGLAVVVSVDVAESVKLKKGTVHIRDLVLAEGEWLMDTTEACDVLGISRVTLGVRREEGLLTKVEIGKKGGGVRYISSEIMEMRQWYSVPKGKV